MDKKEICLNSSELFPAVSEMLAGDARVCIAVTGTSMTPFLMHLRDTLELSKPDFSSLKAGDIVLALRPDGKYVLHRVHILLPDSFYMIGDAQQWLDGPYLPDQLVAVVKRAWRKGKQVNLESSFLWRFVFYLWRLCLPCRHFLIKIMYGINTVIYRLFKRKKAQRTNFAESGSEDET